MVIIFVGDYPAIDFEKKLYSEAMTILEEHVNPRPVLPGVVLEQVNRNKVVQDDIQSCIITVYSVLVLILCL